MPTRLIGTDSANPRLPAGVITATQGATAADLAPGNIGTLTLDAANTYTDDAIADVTAAGVNFATNAETIAGTATAKAVSPAGLKAAQTFVDARSFGAVGNGTADDTTALQAWADHITTNHKVGWLPNGTYRITAPIIFKTATGWSVIGEDRAHTIVRQHTNNVAVFQFGDTLGSQIFHSIVLHNVALTYNTPQPAANTNAIGLRLYTMMYYSQISMLNFSNCAWGIKATGESGEFSPWGTTWDDFNFGGLGIGAINIEAGGGGTPNNIFGRMTINCAGAVGPILDIQAYNTTFQAIEFLDPTNAQLFRLSPNGQIWIGAVKIELATYTAAFTLFDFQGGSQVHIGSVSVGGTYATFNPASGLVALMSIGSGAAQPGFLQIGSMYLTATSITGVVVAIGSSAQSRTIIGDVQLLNGWTLQYNAGSIVSDVVRVLTWANGHVSDDNGNADKTVAVRDPTTQLFRTAFSAPRTFTLPNRTSANLFAGLTFKIVVDGAINGANTLTIREAGGNTLRIQTTDKVVLDYSWKRITAGPGAWLLTGYQTLP